ncbi:MAG: Nitrilase/cyanide hydratase and apolipoprotein N-acyltransferase [Actinomycetia bacterium]|nr:Nitrilase/cyanide hydratase and apolipoprotein N-acyltransferase [Actinomycetes bacterium]
MALDIEANAEAHAELIRAAGARLITFPELSLTGYELENAPSITVDSPVLQPIVDACARSRSTALVGAPIGQGGAHHIAMLAVNGSGTEIAFRKMWLGGEEATFFAAGDQPAVLDLNGVRFGLAICKDTGTPRHAVDTAALGMDCFGVYVAFASFAGPTGSGYGQTAGCSGIWDRRGVLVATAGPDADRIVVATLT